MRRFWVFLSYLNVFGGGYGGFCLGALAENVIGGVQAAADAVVVEVSLAKLRGGVAE